MSVSAIPNPLAPVVHEPDRCFSFDYLSNRASSCLSLFHARLDPHNIWFSSAWLCIAGSVCISLICARSDLHSLYISSARSRIEDSVSPTHLIWFTHGPPRSFSIRAWVLYCSSAFHMATRGCYFLLVGFLVFWPAAHTFFLLLCCRDLVHFFSQLQIVVLLISFGFYGDLLSYLTLAFVFSVFFSSLTAIFQPLWCYGGLFYPHAFYCWLLYFSCF